ncbi:WD domain protein [Hyphopichia burtonii NRRL Y-1933]|uniref:WD domain protein n=1 Tax=Hyphopichia burtonii NRRL Y-1933 TaxID=984485 RepID=A0A1E4RIV0_9ASCO|nr:WD domain protein [Hyphopichia burtonii NRRL Y-1933]ODV67202.1 WD domain protein [Hyphopichia burtonii NRRL Y-1933]
MEEPAAKKPKLAENGGGLNGEVESQRNGHGAIDGAFTDLYTLKFTVKNDTKESFNAVEISPDGTKFATCSSDSTIKIYSTDTGEKVSELRGHTKGISDIAFSPINPNIIASCSDDMTIRLWSINKGKCIKILKKHTYHVTTIKFILKGNILISGSADETVTIWDLSSGRSLKTLAAHSDPVSSIGLTPDNTIIISASYDGLMRLFDLELGQCLKTLVYNSASHGTATASTNDVVNFPISNVEISPNGKYILSSSLDGKIRLWDYMDNKVIKTYSGIDGVSSVSEKYGSSSRFLTKINPILIVSGSDSNGLLFWDVQTKKIVCQIENHCPILDLDTWAQGELLISCDLSGELKVYQLNSKYVKSTESESLPDSPR